MDDEIAEEISQICKKHNSFFENISSVGAIVKDSTIENEHEHVYFHDTPIIFLEGIFERINKFEIQLVLGEKLRNMGYRVTQVGTRDISKLFGIHAFPNFMLDKSLTESHKIILFNHYIKKLELEEKPDVIIIGIPGGTMPISDVHVNRFGILAYEIYCAVKPDAVILSLLYEKNLHSEQILKLVKYHKNRYGCNIDCVNIGNTILNKDFNSYYNLSKFTTVNWQLIKDKKEKYRTIGIPVFNILEKRDQDNIADFLIDVLAEENISKVKK